MKLRLRDRGIHLTNQQLRLCMEVLQELELKNASQGRGGAKISILNLHPETARDLIKDGSKKALLDYKKIKPFTLNSPYLVNVEFLHSGYADAVEILPYVKRETPLSISFISDDILDCYRLIRSSIMIASSIS